MKHYWPGATFELPWGFSCEDGSTPCGVLVLLSSKPRDKSFLGALIADTSSVMPICFCLLRFLLHSSWQSCHKGRLEKKHQIVCQRYFLTTPQNCYYLLQSTKADPQRPCQLLLKTWDTCCVSSSIKIILDAPLLQGFTFTAGLFFHDFWRISN